MSVRRAVARADEQALPDEILERLNLACDVAAAADALGTALGRLEAHLRGRVPDVCGPELLDPEHKLLVRAGIVRRAVADLAHQTSAWGTE